MKRNWVILFLVLAAFAGCTNRNYSSGDRVLVSRYIYELGVRSPQRFDVVVFKYPEAPVKNNVPRNYIKRLLGLPGEILAIFFGRIFRWAPGPGEAPPFQDHQDAKIAPERLWEREHMHTGARKSLELFDAGQFEIVRKPPHVQLAMRRIVYDHDYQPKDLKDILPSRWTPKAGSAWNAVDKSLSHSGAIHKEGVDWIRYQHVLRPLPTKEDREEPLVGGRKVEPDYITDLLGYNTNFPAPIFKSLRALSRGEFWVGDLMLDCQVEVKNSQGEFWMELSKGIHRFQARFDLETGKCALFRLDLDGKRTPMGEADTNLKSPGKYQVRFANIDARLTVWIDNALPFDDGVAYDPPEVRRPSEKDLDEEALKKRRGPEPKNDLEPASLGSSGAAVSIHHLQLWRDTYYTRGDANMPFTMYVQPGHYLCLGDNSPQSSDGRDWGLVPERLLLGRALLVYYPFNRAGMIR